MRPTTGSLGNETVGTNALNKSPRVGIVIILAALLMFTLGTSTKDSAEAAAGGRVKAWGANGSHQLGNGSTDEEHSPVFVPNLNNVENISSGCTHVLAVKRNGTVRGWGSNNRGQLGTPDPPNDTTTPTLVSGLDNVKAVATGASHSLALKENGTVRAFGSNDKGELGNDDAPNDSPVPVKVKGLDNVKAITAGQNVSYALKENGTVWSWGQNESGQLGDGDSPNDSPVPVKVKNLDDAKAIATNCSGFHVLAVKKNGTVRAWGYGGDGVLGNGLEDDSDVPVRVSRLDNVKDVSSGYRHSLALKKNGIVWAWGYNTDGQLGNGNTDEKHEPVKVKNLDGAKELAGGSTSSFAIKRTGTVRAWGSNANGQLGDGSTDPRYLPVRVGNLTDVVHIASGGSATYAVKK